jgi:hypothetical protein
MNGPNVMERFDFSALPRDIQKEIVRSMDMTESTFEVFEPLYKQLMTNDSFVIGNLHTGDVEPLTIMVKKLGLTSTRLLDVLEKVDTWDEGWMPCLCTLTSLCAVLGWHEVGRFVVKKIACLGVWNISSLPGMADVIHDL